MVAFHRVHKGVEIGFFEQVETSSFASQSSRDASYALIARISIMAVPVLLGVALFFISSVATRSAKCFGRKGLRKKESNLSV